jgi:hypothetical protein
MSPPVFLPHAETECPGRWKAIGPDECYVWRCIHCSREHPSTPENDRSAVYENALGVMMHVMALNASLPPAPPLPPRTEFTIDLGRIMDDDDDLDIDDFESPY